MTTEPIPPRRPFGMVDEVFIDVDAEAMRVFQESIGYTPGTIQVAKFCGTQLNGNQNMPQYMAGVPEDETEEAATEQKADGIVRETYVFRNLVRRV